MRKSAVVISQYNASFGRKVTFTDLLHGETNHIKILVLVFSCEPIYLVHCQMERH